MPVSIQDFRAGMRQLAAAVNVITCGTKPDRHGLTATAVMSLTAEPPQIGVAVNKSASAFEHIRTNAHFAVNVLSKHQVDVATAFSNATGPKGDTRFATGEWSTISSGAPTLEHATVVFDCTLAREIDLGTHVLLVGSIEAVKVNANEPLLYMDGTWAGLVKHDAGK
jgi:flavin reductase (DIM6/NTAB) family NADH-FMN oxidoreductase RutF